MQFSPTLMLIVTPLLLVTCMILLSYRAQTKLKKSLAQASDEALYQSQFKCVMVSPCTHSCRSAQEQKKPILLSSSPSLPLAGCTERKCECTFIQLEDRRSGNDRRSNESPEKRRIYMDKRWLKDRRRNSIADFMLPKYRTVRLGQAA